MADVPMKTLWALWMLVDQSGAPMLTSSNDGGKWDVAVGGADGVSWIFDGDNWSLRDASGLVVATVKWSSSDQALLTMISEAREVELKYPGQTGLSEEPTAPATWPGWSWNGTTMSHDGHLEPGLWISSLLNCREASRTRYFYPVHQARLAPSFPAEALVGPPNEWREILSLDLRPCPNLGGRLAVITDEKDYYRAQRDSQ